MASNTLRFTNKLRDSKQRKGHIAMKAGEMIHIPSRFNDDGLACVGMKWRSIGEIEKLVVDGGSRWLRKDE